MANILTAQEAAAVLRCAVDDDNMLDLLPLVDAYLENASGRDWTGDTPIQSSAKAAARMLLVRLHEDPGNLAAQPFGLGLAAALTQLEALALRYFTYSGQAGAGPITLAGAHVGDSVASVTGRVGASGDQSAAFEALITVEGQIQQLSAADLSEKWYTAHLVPPAAV